MDLPRLRRSFRPPGFKHAVGESRHGYPVAVCFVSMFGGQFAGVGIAAAIGVAKADVARLGGRIDRYSELVQVASNGEPSWRRCERTW